MRHLATAAALLIVSACAPEATDDPFAEHVIDDAKEDSAARPTRKGAVPFDTTIEDGLTPITSGYHLYRLRAHEGWSVRIMMESTELKPYLRLTSPSGQTWWDAAEVKTAGTSTYTAILDVFDLPEDGEYQVLATSVTNMSFFPFAKSWGAYTIGAETDVECRLGAPADECPETLTCRHDARDREGFGTCLRP
jgi:hypothetical protein